MLKVLSFDPTPNPNAMKFTVEGRLIEGGSATFDTPEAAASDPLAQALFQLGKVASVFYMPGFVTVVKHEAASWGALAPAIARVIETTAPAIASAGMAAAEAEGALVRINQVIDEQIRPALAADGGGLEVVALEGRTLTIRYQGACGSCPSAIAGTLQAIQNLLQAEVDESLIVQAA